MATGMEAIIKIPLRKRPGGLLLDHADRIPNSVRWSAGVTMEPYGCGGFVSVDADYCDYNADELDEFFATGSIPKFNAFQVYNTEECSALDSDIDTLNGRLDDRWSVMLSEQFASRLQAELAARADVVSTGPLNAVELVSLAEQVLAVRLHGGVGMLHVSPSVLAVLTAVGPVFADGAGWRTPGGHVVVADAGHTGLPPTGETAPADTEWVYVTGQVAYGLSDPTTTTRAVEYLNREKNVVTGRIIGTGVVAFEPCVAAAIQFGYPSFDEGS